MRDVKKIAGMMLVAVMVLFLAGGCSKAQSGQGGTAKQEEAKKQYVLKFNHVLGPSEPYHEAFLKWAKNVEEKTNGGLKIEVYHSSQLGLEEDIIEQIRQGANVGQNTDSARLGNYVPEIAVMNAPYFVQSLDEVAKLKELPTVKAWMEKLDKEYGLKVLSFNWVQGYRHFLTNKPIKTPEDLKGLRIRTPGAPIWQESVRALGATPVALPFGEVYPGIQQKVIDGAELVYMNVNGGQLYEVAKYMSETKHIMLINFEVISSKFFNSLPPEYQKVLVEECDKAGMEVSKQIMEKYEKEAKEQVKAKGLTIIEDVDMEAFQKAGEKAYEALKLTEVRDKIYGELGKK
ncbi:C4-dicarboxylate TRAP transporter substrate-binding protein [Moorella sulfitireducens (nom. illeg.)]|uniref:C4-dicarboxylate TRAP transporter substrate-binding protein n=1 Tax=Neomoorella sulfitireducens TaxID=2972948 RepID=UPI0021AC5EE5|nr:C4-dicarboxylate TRAP transporter substrate-binding protein [Moorella sulfitireducens]